MASRVKSYNANYGILHGLYQLSFIAAAVHTHDFLLQKVSLSLLDAFMFFYRKYNLVLEKVPVSKFD